MDVKMSC